MFPVEGEASRERGDSRWRRDLGADRREEPGVI